MKKRLFLILLLVLLTGCAQPQPTAPETAPSVPVTETPTTEATLPPDSIGELLESMTIEEQVGQLFLVRCPESGVTETIAQYHPGGLLLFGRDIDGQTPDSLTETIQTYQQAASVPMLIAVDEEGGTVCRVSSHSAFRQERFPSPRALYDQGGLEAILATEQEKCELLSTLGINVNLAPVCDLADDPNGFLYSRSLGQSPEITAEFVASVVKTMNSHKIGSALKHFPGYGNNSDTHTGIAMDQRPYDEFLKADFLPFQAGIEAGCGAILVSHNTVLAMDEAFPASLSPAVHRILREELGFTGVILTDDLVMDAISQVYGAGDAAVLAIQAGNDLLCVSDLPTQYQAVLDAVRDDTLSPGQIATAARRVLTWKQNLGLI